MISSTENPSSRVIRKHDFTAFMMLALGTFLLLGGPSAEMTRETGPFMYATSGLAFVTLIVVPLFLRWKRRVVPGEDEYFRRLIGIAAMAGFYLSFSVFCVWAPLSGTLLPDPTGVQIVAIMVIGAALGWFVARWRDAL